MNRLSQILVAGIGAALLLAGVTARAEQPPVENVLVLQSFDRGLLAVDHFTGAFRVGLVQRNQTPVNMFQVIVGPTGFVGASEEAVVDYINASFADREPPDLIVTVAGPAAVFARRHRADLFPDTPLLYASVDERWLAGQPLAPNESAVAVQNDVPGLIDEILTLRPATKRVFMVVGSGTLGRFWHEVMQEELSRFGDRVEFEWSD